MINETEAKAPTLFNSALKWGIINAAVGILVVIVCYVIDYSLLASFKLLGVGIVLGLAIIIYGGIEYRNSVGGYLTYGTAWQHGFFTLAVGGIISVVFNIILYTVIDPELPEKVTESVMETTRSMMENFGMQEGPEMDKALDKARVDSLARLTPFGFLKNYLFGLIVYAIIACVTAIFVKRNPPVDQM